MKESITFPEELIPDVVRIIRRGLNNGGRSKKDRREAIILLYRACQELEDYWKRTTGMDLEPRTRKDREL